ncbi:HRDC domain-containing protein [Marinilactibacillus kalidii]|uniref:HRDC domain-containing protein n=1 Tax=Marinilactibacillus kalidii TaxID=2820274 RepID=UPI001ABDBB6E|nr:HRDC domain-containing protein [Marinilactibacillus kalidii]
MNIFGKLKEPIFLKEDSNMQEQLDRLKELESSLTIEGTKVLKQDIKNLEYGMIGENSIEYELKNSHLPMYVLHDIYLEDGDLSAQIDYIVFTKKLIFVIESKNLYGDIEINQAGDFIRTTAFKGRKKKEGIYSPITQNQRHIDLMKKLRVHSKGNFLTKLLSQRNFEEMTKSVVVLSNPKTVLNARFAKKEVKEKVIRADQLVKYINDAQKQSNRKSFSDKEMLEWANMYLNLHKEAVKDYTKKYETYKVDKNSRSSKTLEKAAQLNTNKKSTRREKPLEKVEKVEKVDIYQALKSYRLNKSREDNIKAYYIFSNKQLTALAEKLPKTKDELLSIEGFGEAKVTKYGLDIIRIIRKY